MKGLYGDEFAGYRIASSEEHDRALKEAVVAVDANVLLDLYRFRERTSTDLLLLLRSLGDRLVVPHQALREFWRNRSRSQASPRRATQAAVDIVNKADRSMQDAVETWAKAVGTDQDELNNLSDRIRDFVLTVVSELRSALPDEEEEREDTVLTQLEVLLEGKVTAAPSAEEYEDCLQEARRRIAAEEPPGFLDVSKEEDGPEEGAAGDYLVWFQSTRHAIQRQKDLIIVTRDEKADWWWRQQTKFIGPRSELTREYYNLSGRRLFLMRPADLLARASILDVEISEESASEIERFTEAERHAEHAFDAMDHEEVDESTPWTAKALRLLLAQLDENHRVQADALRMATVERKGRVSRNAIYQLGNYPSNRVLRGFTRPYLRFTEQLQDAGLIPQGVAPIFVANYPDGVRTSYFSVPPEVPQLLDEIGERR